MIYYNQAADILKSNNDYLWYGGTLEGIAAHFICKMYMFKEYINPQYENEITMKDKINEQVFNSYFLLLM